MRGEANCMGAFSLPKGEGIGGLRPPSCQDADAKRRLLEMRQRRAGVGSPHPPALPATSPPGRYSRRDLAGELVLDVGTNDIVEARLGPEAERERALALEPLRP